MGCIGCHLVWIYNALGQSTRLAFWSANTQAAFFWRWPQFSIELIKPLSNPRTTNRLHEVFHGFQFPCCSICPVLCPRIASNFSKNKLESQTNPLTFRLTNDAAECKIYEITGKTVIYSFRSITRNITRWLFLPVSRWFIWFFDEPGFLLIRRSLVRAQVEEPRN